MEQLKQLYDLFCIILTNLNNNKKFKNDKNEHITRLTDNNDLLIMFESLIILYDNINVTYEHINLLFNSPFFDQIMFYNTFDVDATNSNDPIYRDLHFNSILFLRYLTMGNQMHIGVLLKENILQKLLIILREHDSETTLVSSLCSLSNLIAGSAETLNLLFDSRMMNSILYLAIKLKVKLKLLNDSNYESEPLTENEQKTTIETTANIIEKKRFQTLHKHATIHYHLIKLFETIFDIATEKQILQLCDQGIISTLLILINDKNLPSESICSLLNMLLVIYRLCPIDVNSVEYKETVKQIEYHCSQPEIGILPFSISMEQIANPHLYTHDKNDKSRYNYCPPSFNQRHYLYIFGFSFINELKQRYTDDTNIHDRISMFSNYVPSTSSSSSSTTSTCSFLCSFSTLLSSFERICRIVPYDSNFLSGWLIVNFGVPIRFVIEYFNNVIPSSSSSSTTTSSYGTNIPCHHYFFLHGRHHQKFEIQIQAQLPSEIQQKNFEFKFSFK
jgi:hypothetical protein